MFSLSSNPHTTSLIMVPINWAHLRLIVSLVYDSLFVVCFVQDMLSVLRSSRVWHSSIFHVWHSSMFYHWEAHGMCSVTAL